MHLHLDLVAGIAGDMTVAALLDAGAPFEAVERALRALPLPPFMLVTTLSDVGMSITARRFEVQELEPGQDLPDYSAERAAWQHPVEHGHDHDHHAAHDHGHDHHAEHDHGHDHHAEHDHNHDHHGDHDHDHHGEHDHDHHAGHDHGHDHHAEHDHGHDHHAKHDHGHDHGHGGHRSWAHIRAMLEGAPMLEPVKARALAIFGRLAAAEGRVHGVEPELVTFHEVGALDSIVDIVAASACLHALGVERVTASPVPVGRGFAMSQHGRIPLPAPATLFLLEGAATAPSGLHKELVTPTGAAILAEVVDEYVDFPAFVPVAVGMGGGTMALPDRPNLLRAILGEPRRAPGMPGLEVSRDVVLEANLDDMTGELCGYVAEQLLAQGALDVWWTPTIMKKGRPAQMLSVLCLPADQDRLAGLILRETSSLGVRRAYVERLKAQRDFVEVETPWGAVRVKRGLVGGVVRNVAPEYESAREVALAAGVPLKDVMLAALRAVEPQ